MNAIGHCLAEISDPEFPISIVDLGLVYDIIKQQGEVTVEITFTHTACPCMDWIISDIRNKLLTCEEVLSVDVKTVWEPAWDSSRISENGKRQLQHVGSRYMTDHRDRYAVFARKSKEEALAYIGGVDAEEQRISQTNCLATLR